MAKTPQWIINLKQPQKGKRHGKHRQPNPKAYSRPDGASGDGTGRTITWAGNFTIPALPGSIRAKPRPKPAIPYAGVRAGEIVSYRVWRVMHGMLWSMVANRVWIPSQPMYGDINGVIYHSYLSRLEILGGVYSFKDMDAAFAEFMFCKVHAELCVECKGEEYVLGAVQCWGELVEHEHGYRAEYAKVHKLYAGTTSDVWLQHLREIYNVSHNNGE